MSFVEVSFLRDLNIISKLPDIVNKKFFGYNTSDTDRGWEIDMKNRTTLIIIIILAVLAVAAAVIIVIKCSGAKEEFADVRAYRTVDDLFDDITIDGDEPVIIDRDMYDHVLREEAAEAYRILNEERIANGLSPLMWEARLENSAITRSCELSAVFGKNHERPNGSYWFTVDTSHILGENIYKGKRTAADAMKSWLNHDIDRENFMCTEFTKCSISLYENSDGEYFWAAAFAADTE